MWDLRPLGAGELLDRAVTLFVRRFMPIVVVLAVVYIPINVVAWLIVGPAMERMGLFAGHPLRTFPPGFAVDYTLRIIAVAVLQTAALLLARTALVDVLGAAYAGATRSPRAAYALAVRRWPAQLGAATLSGLVLVVIMVVWGIGFTAGSLVLGLAGSRGAGVAVAIVVFLAVSVVTGLCAAWVYIAAQLASVEIAGGMGGLTAFGYGLRVATDPKTRWRMLVAALVVGAMLFGLEIVVTIFGALAQALTHLTALQFGAAAVVAIVFEGLTTAFLVVFAVDVKVRREGLDLDRVLAAV